MRNYAKFMILAMLILLTASCAPKKWAPPGEKPGVEVGRHLEERWKSESATEKIAVGRTGATFYFDKRLWTTKRKAMDHIDFETRRFTNAHIFLEDGTMPMTQIYKILVRRYDLKDARLLESEFVRVNGDAVIFNKIEGRYGRKPVVMLSYGYSGDGHTVVAYAYVYKGMLRPQTEAEMVEFLNGFVARD
jgi:hypothetical protein